MTTTRQIISKSLNRQKLNNELKQKAKDNIYETPSKCVHKELARSDINTLLITSFNLIKIKFFFKISEFLYY